MFEKINKIDSYLARLIRRRREKTKITNIRNKRGHIIDSTDSKSIIRDIKNNFMLIKLVNLEEMEKFCDRRKSPKLVQEEIDNLDSSTLSK